MIVTIIINHVALCCICAVLYLYSGLHCIVLNCAVVLCMYYQSVTSQMEDGIRAVHNDAATSLSPAYLHLSTYRKRCYTMV